MNIKTHQIGKSEIAEVFSDDYVIASIDDGSDLVGTLYFQGFDKVVVHQKNIVPKFFELNNRMAGEILQKVSNYRVQLAIVGEFSQYNSKSLSDFITESNKGKQVNFVSTTKEALDRLSG